MALSWGGKTSAYSCLLLDPATAPSWASAGAKDAIAEGQALVLFIDAVASSDGPVTIYESVGTINPAHFLPWVPGAHNMVLTLVCR